MADTRRTSQKAAGTRKSGTRNPAAKSASARPATTPSSGPRRDRPDPLPIPLGPHQQAGRKRSRSRQMRRFESVVGRLDVPGRVSAGKDALIHWRNTPQYLSKALSALLLAGVIAAFSAIHVQDDWFVYAEDIHMENLVYLDTADLTTQLEVEGWNILWLQPEALRSRLLEHTGIVDAQVRLQLPGRIEITVVERQAVALWITNRGVYRLADNGTVLSGLLTPEAVAASAADRTLPQIVDPLQEAQQPGITDAPVIDQEILDGARALLAALPELENRVRYNQGVGLNFPLPGDDGWVYWGDGLHRDEKVINLTAARQYMAENEVESRIVDVRFLNRPYLR